MALLSAPIHAWISVGMIFKDVFATQRLRNSASPNSKPVNDLAPKGQMPARSGPRSSQVVTSFHSFAVQATAKMVAAKPWR
jgi:hypothetical protein